MKRPRPPLMPRAERLRLIRAPVTIRAYGPSIHWGGTPTQKQLVRREPGAHDDDNLSNPEEDFDGTT